MLWAGSFYLAVPSRTAATACSDGVVGRPARRSRSPLGADQQQPPVDAGEGGRQRRRVVVVGVADLDALALDGLRAEGATDAPPAPSPRSLVSGLRRSER
jgi:hypothetical protein